MSNWYQQWESNKKIAQSSANKTLKKLGSKNNKTINTIADEVHEEVFERIDCLECGNCCKSIPPIVNDTDVKRISKFLNISTKEFNATYVRMDTDGDQVMNQSPCPFLGANNMCDIYEVRPKACRQYPHTDGHEFTKHFKLHKQNISYCPAVYHIIEEMVRRI